MLDRSREELFDSLASTPDAAKYKELIEPNQSARVIMAAATDKCRPATPKQIEGALQAHLRRTAETRKYLITGVSSYTLLDTVIKNEFSSGLDVLGMKGDIQTPVTRQASGSQ